MSQLRTVDSSVRDEIIADMRTEERRVGFMPLDNIESRSNNDLRARTERLRDMPGQHDRLGASDIAGCMATHSKVNPIGSN